MKIILADDHELIRRAMAIVLQKVPNATIIAEATNGEELTDVLKKHTCDILCLDIYMPKFKFFDALQQCKKINKNMKIIIQTSVDDPFLLKKILKEDVHGIILKSDPSDIIGIAFRTVFNGKTFYSPTIQDLINRDYLGSLHPNKLIDVLTPQEKKVMALVARGYKNKDIAAELEVQEFTIDFHKKNIKNKMNISSNAEMTRLAIEHNLI
jgi:DNA-binding NarL/FixJ family response regulator